MKTWMRAVLVVAAVAVLTVTTIAAAKASSGRRPHQGRWSPVVCPRPVVAPHVTPRCWEVRR